MWANSVFVIRIIYHLHSTYLAQILQMEGICQPDSCQSNLTSFSWLNLCQVFVIGSIVSITYQHSLTIYGRHIDHGVYMFFMCISSGRCLILLTLFNLHHMFMLRSVSLLSYLGSSYLLPPLIIEGWCQPATGHLILASLSWSILCRTNVRN